MVDGIKNWSKLRCVGVFFKYNNIFFTILASCFGAPVN